jgi:predicted RNase H-like nuclease
MAYRKGKPEGRAERLALLRTVFTDIDSHVGRKIFRTRPDDVLDAFVAAWSARRWASKTHLQLGGDVDERGLRMEMIV